MMYPLVLDLAADKIPVTVTCRVLGFSTQAFYAWRKEPVTQRDWDDAHLIDAAVNIHHDDPAFGYRFIADELPAGGITAGENRVARLCSVQRIFSVFAKKPGLSKRAGPPVHDDLVQRAFSASAPNATWLTDITEHRTDEGKLYLCAVKDLHSNRIVGYSIDLRHQLNPDRIDFADLDADTIAGFLELLVQVPESTVTAVVDWSMWATIVTNLVSNAVKYTRHGQVRVHPRTPRLRRWQSRCRATTSRHRG